MAAPTEPKPHVTGYPVPAPPPAAAPGPANLYPAPPPAATAYPYPYPAPPPHASSPPMWPPYQPRTTNPPSRFSNLLLRRIIVAAIAGFLIAGSITLIVWMILRPRLPAVSVTSLSVSSFKTSTAPPQLSGQFDVSLSVQNPNRKMGIYYDAVSAGVLYETYPLAETSLPPFYQGKGSSSSLHASMAALAEYVEPDLLKEIADRRAHGGAVGFEVKVVALVRYRAGAWRTSSNVIRAYCRDLTVGFSNRTVASGGSLVGERKRCVVST